MGSAAGLSDQKILDLDRYLESELYTESEKVALRYADAMTLSDQDVDDQLFAEIKEHYSTEQIVELTATIAWENASSKFNRALRVESQNLWKRMD